MPTPSDRPDAKSAPKPVLKAAERLPECLLPATPERPAEALYARHCGRPLRVVVCPAGAALPPEAPPGTERLLLHPSGSQAMAGGAGSVLRDEADGRILRAMTGLDWPAVATPLALQYDARLRLIDRCAPDAPCPDGVAGPALPPPLLWLPGLFDRALCAALISAHRSAHAASGVHRRQADGAVVLAEDRRVKSRQDHLLTDPALAAAVAERIGRVLVPAIAQAFSVPVSRHETPKVVAYHAEAGGHFAAHRDNVTADARHRRFALTVNLDAGYTGGGLQFPEFDDTPRGPAPGAALVFSGSLLHRVLPVTAGSRHALVSFLW